MNVHTCNFIPLSDILRELSEDPACCYDYEDLCSSFSEHCTVSYGDANRTLVTEATVWSILEDMGELPSSTIEAVAAKLVELGKPCKGKVPYIDLSN
jgi:hypothetical protein